MQKRKAKKIAGTRRKHKKSVRKSCLDDPRFMKRFDAACAKWKKKVQPLIDAAERSTQLTAEDFNTFVGAV